MKLDLTATGVLALAAVAAIAGLYLWNRRAIGAAVSGAVEAVNPASENNLINRGVSSIGQAVTGDDSWSLGGQLAEWLSPEVAEANEMMRAQPLPPVDRAIMDANDARATRGTGAGVTGYW